VTDSDEARPTVRIGHSPDADDAFMFWAMASGRVAVPGYRVEHVMEDIESLNRRAQTGELEVTAISAAAYPLLAGTYRLLRVGASIGRAYGPVVVARKAIDPALPVRQAGLAGRRVAVPGQYTTAYLLLRLFAAGFEPVFTPFDRVLQSVAAGEVDAGLVIHEGQVTYEREGFVKVLDLGEEWHRATGLPIPLGLNAVRRDLGPQVAEHVRDALLASIREAQAHEDEALDYALRFGRGVDREAGRRFVRMYVNDDTLDLGEEGRAALESLYARAVQRGILEAVPPLDIV
jgi:1,4-dihydroxy-6-naphthoate synthase